ncbi:MAG: hypothetical protein QGH83_14100 [Candidatus Pacebacteria bacterium]|jgi:hypothetical protein|nr:hypothetical protein [Candidatus Paceibacterota bacterium]
MANDFKSFSKSNVAIDSGTYSTLYTVPYTASPVESILLEIDVANTHASNDITVDVKVNKNSGGTGGTDDIFIVKAAPVPVGGALKVVSGQKIVLMSTATGADTVTVAASAASSADCIVSLLEDV